jgi:hypothetical protein
MLESPNGYGPQFDPSDGTIGHLQLVKRWVLVSGPAGLPWPAHQGRYTHATRKAAVKFFAAVTANNRPGVYPEDLRVVPWWCYPVHHDPAGHYPKEMFYPKTSDLIKHLEEMIASQGDIAVAADLWWPSDAREMLDESEDPEMVALNADDVLARMASYHDSSRGFNDTTLEAAARGQVRAEREERRAFEKKERDRLIP